MLKQTNESQLKSSYCSLDIRLRLDNLADCRFGALWKDYNCLSDYQMFWDILFYTASEVLIAFALLLNNH